MKAWFKRALIIGLNKDREIGVLRGKQNLRFKREDKGAR